MASLFLFYVTRRLHEIDKRHMGTSQQRRRRKMELRFLFWFFSNDAGEKVGRVRTHVGRSGRSITHPQTKAKEIYGRQRQRRIARARHKNKDLWSEGNRWLHALVVLVPFHMFFFCFFSYRSRSQEKKIRRRHNDNNEYPRYIFSCSEIKSIGCRNFGNGQVA